MSSRLGGSSSFTKSRGSEKSSKIVLDEFHKQVSCLEKLNKENLGIVVKNVQNKTNLKGPNLWLPLRYAITLEVKGPDLNMIIL